MFSPTSAARRSSARAAATSALVPFGAPPCHVGDSLGLDPPIDPQDRLITAERRRLGLGELVDTDDHLFSRLDQPRSFGHRRHQAGLQRLHGGERSTQRQNVVEFRPRSVAQLRRACFDDLGSVEEVVVLEQVALVGQHLLHPQRPLLIPRARQTERLVPRRQLDAAGSSRLGERHGEHFQDDALDVVLRLRLGEPEAVHLDPVAEAQRLRVADPVTLPPDALPEHPEGAQLAHLLDEADPGVDEEGDRRKHLSEAIRGNLPGVAHGVEHADSGCQRKRQFLYRRGAGLLQVVRADVDRVPHRRVRRAPGHHVDRQPARRFGREDVGPPRQIFLDDVVLCRAAQLGGSDALLLGVGDVQGEQPRRRGVDRHRRVHLRRRNAVEQRAHVPEMTDRHANLADLAASERRVRVVSRLRRQVERHGQAGLALGEVRAVQLVRRRGGGVPGVGAHDPRAVTVVVAGLSFGHRSCSTSPGPRLRQAAEGTRRDEAESPRATPGVA